MYAATFFSLALASLVSGLLIPRHDIRHGHKKWDTAKLENYTDFHDRFTALGCQGKTGTDFFDRCCHPLSANQTAADLPPECSITGTGSTLAQVDDDNDCGDGNDDHVPASAPAPAPSSTKAAPTPDAPAPKPAPSQPAPSPSSSKAAPTPDAPAPKPAPSQPAPSPSPSPSPKPAPTSQAAPPPAPTPVADSASANADVNRGGFATYFYQGGNAGACGTVHGDYDYVAAMDIRRYNRGLCGSYVSIRNPSNGRSVRAKIADMCPTCENGNCIDLSVGAFQAIADLSQGKVAIEWTYA